RCGRSRGTPRKPAVHFGSAQNVSSPTFTSVWGLSPISMQAIAVEADCLVTSFCVAVFELQSTTFLLLSTQSPTLALEPPPQPPAARAATAPSPHAARRRCRFGTFMCRNPPSSRASCLPSLADGAQRAPPQDQHR